MPFTDLLNVPKKEILPGFTAQMIHMENMTYSWVTVKAGSILPEHSHPHEQISTLIQGHFEMTISGETNLLKEGQVAVIPSDALHSGKALTDCVILDVFSPVREDYK